MDEPVALQFAVVIFLPQLAINVLTNSPVRTDIPEWKDTLFTVVFSTAGVWLCCMLNVILLHSGGAALCNWNSAFALVLMLPLTTQISCPARLEHRLDACGAQFKAQDGAFQSQRIQHFVNSFFTLHLKRRGGKHSVSAAPFKS